MNGRIVRALAVIVCATSALIAQTTGELRGTVKDTSGRVVAAARVSARFSGTGVVRSSETGGDGTFLFPSVAAGDYTVEVEAPGFKSYAQPYVDVTLGRVVNLSIELESGDATQVLAMDTPLVETANTQLGAVVDSHAVVALPLNTRDTYQLLQLQPGVQSQQGYDLFAGSEFTGVVSVNGGRGRSNNFSVNGGDANDLFLATPAIQPTPDSIQEFRVLTSLFDAEFGRNSGSVVNVVTKRGTDEYHGSLFEFFRNRALNTRGFFDAEKPKFNQNQFGGTVGGPMRKNQTSFFASTEVRKIRNGISSDLVNVPSATERAGDFSNGATFSGTLNDSYLADVLNRRPGCAAAVAGAGGAPIAPGTAWSAIFPGNVIPGHCFDGTAADLLNNYVPLPNSGANVLHTVPVRSESAVQSTLRLDHTVNARHQLGFYYYVDDSSVTQPFSRFQAAGSNIPGFGSLYDTRNQQYNFSHTWAVNAAAVNEFRFTYFRSGQLNFNHPQNTDLVNNSCKGLSQELCFSDPTTPKLGITPGLGGSREGMPFIAVSGGFAMGNNQEGELPQVGNSFQWSDSFSRVFGSHRAKFGADVRRYRFDQTLYFDVNGFYTFGGGGANEVGADTFFPDYLLGLPTIYSQGSAQAQNLRSTMLHLFAQDSWSIRPNLTLNYGLRWELNTPWADIARRVQTFRPGQATAQFPCRLNDRNPLVETFGGTDCNPGSAGASVFPLGLVTPGDSGISPALTATYYGAFAPRVGIAWAPAAGSGWMRRLLGGPGKTSIRAGWGMFYNAVEQLVLEQLTGQPPFGGSSILSNTLFNTPFVGQDGTVNGNPFSGMLNPQPGVPLDWSTFRPITLYGELEPRLRPQYSVNYHFTIQREIRRDTLLQLAYVGAQGHHLLATRDLNYGQAQPCLDLNRLADITGDGSLGCGPFSSDSSYTIPAGAIPEGFTLHLPYGPAGSVTGPNANPITLVGLRRYSAPSCNPLTGAGCPPDGIPVFGSIFAQDSIANSNYNSLQISLEKRALTGLEFQMAYTFSKSLDNASSFENLLNPLDYRLSRSLSMFDARHRLVFSYHWELPRITAVRSLGRAVNGWSIAGIAAFQSGLPVPISSADDLELMNSFDFTMPGAPDMVKPFRKLDPRNSQHLAFDPSSFQQPEMGRIGTSPRTVCCGPGLNNFDFAVTKNLLSTERYKAQFRAEFFNALNHAQFTKVDGNISNGDVESGGTFGTVLRARDPRLIQFAVKVLF